MRKKGFTLIELLAVIIILAVIALIVTPTILRVVDNAKKASFKDSVYGAVDAARYYYYENPNTLAVNVDDLNLSNSTLKTGSLNINNGNIEVVNITDGKYCANGYYNDLSISEGSCNLEKGTGSITVFLKNIGYNFITVEVKADEIKPLSYQYKLKNGDGVTIYDWQDSQDTSYTFKDLKEDTNYEVSVRLKTEKLTRPIYELEKKGYNKTNKLKVTYPVYADSNFEYYYSTDGVNFNKLENTNVIELIINENKTIYTRIKDGTNYYDSTYQITTIDNEAPKIKVEPVLEVTEGENKNIFEGVTAEDNTGKYNTVADITDTTKMLPGTYSITYTVTDEAGNSVSALRTLKVKMSSDNSGASAPNINGMIPITYDNGSKTFVVADTNSNWYNYDKKYWANAVVLIDNTITYKVGDVIPESNIKGYFVWVPRYSYKLFDLGNYSSLTTAENRAQEIEITFESKNTPKKKEETLGSFYTHPAFTFGSEELDGIWVAKFKATGTAASPTVKPKISILKGMHIKPQFDSAYNFDRDKDSHMMKNTEWGAMAYLSHSKYGINSNVSTTGSTVYTGYGPKGNFNTDFIETQSTTGNVYGIYDVSSTVAEAMATCVKDYYRNSGFTKANISNYDSKYFDFYPSDTTTSYNNRILGDAIGELGPYGNNYISSWYRAQGYPITQNTWLVRMNSMFGNSNTMGDSTAMAFRITLTN